MFTGKPVRWTGRTRRRLAISQIAAAMPFGILNSTPPGNWARSTGKHKVLAKWQATKQLRRGTPLLDGITVLTEPAAERFNKPRSRQNALDRMG